jgi:hypothetical protein
VRLVAGIQRPILFRRPVKDHWIFRPLQRNRANVDRVVTCLLEKNGERRGQRVVDEEPHSPATRGKARSRTASAAYSKSFSNVFSRDNGRDGNSKPADTRNAPHLPRIRS